MKFAFLTVADPHVGLGHLYRCDALATALQVNNQHVDLLIHSESGEDWLKGFSIDCPWKIVLWKSCIEQLENRLEGYDNVVIDAYDIHESIQKLISAKFNRPIYFDDFGQYLPPRGIVINGSPGAQLIDYPHRDNLTLLIGPDYQVLRKPFWKKTKRVIKKDIQSVGVMLGGTDHSGLMNQVLSIVKSFFSKEVQIFAIGVTSEEVGVDGIIGTGMLNAQGVKDLFDRLDVLISAAGQTIAEAVSCLLPTVMIKTAENQEYNVEGWSYFGLTSIKVIDNPFDLHSDLKKMLSDLLTKGRRETIISNLTKSELNKSTFELSLALLK